MTRTRPIDELAHARRAFFERGNAVGAGELPQTILRSWQRCRRLGLPERDTPSIEPVPEGRLHEMRERNERLRRLARAELELLAADADGSGSIVVLTDDNGWILDATGHPQFLDKASRVALRPGACWNESQAGTNAIGTAIVERRAVEVRGLQQPLTFGNTGTTIALDAARTLGGAHYELNYRFQVPKDLLPGMYPWPVQITAARV